MFQVIDNIVSSVVGLDEDARQLWKRRNHLREKELNRRSVAADKKWYMSFFWLMLKELASIINGLPYLSRKCRIGRYVFFIRTSI